MKIYICLGDIQEQPKELKTTHSDLGKAFDSRTRTDTSRHNIHSKIKIPCSVDKINYNQLDDGRIVLFRTKKRLQKYCRKKSIYKL